MKTAQELIAERPVADDDALYSWLYTWSNEAAAMLLQQEGQIEALKADVERYKWLTVNADEMKGKS